MLFMLAFPTINQILTHAQQFSYLGKSLPTGKHFQYLRFVVSIIVAAFGLFDFSVFILAKLSKFRVSFL